MKPQVIECEQGTPEWFAARRGIPTASEFAAVMAKGKGARTYMLKLAGEIITEESMENFSNWQMERGKIMEAEARQFYSFTTNQPIEQVGFIRSGDGTCGCSPDGLIGKNGVLELKTALPHILIDLILKDEFPPEHVAQTQGGLFVTEREWVELAIFWPKIPMFKKKVGRDEKYIKELASAIADFNSGLTELVEKIRRYQ